LSGLASFIRHFCFDENSRQRVFNLKESIAHVNCNLYAVFSLSYIVYSGGAAAENGGVETAVGGGASAFTVDDGGEQIDIYLKETKS